MGSLGPQAAWSGCIGQPWAAPIAGRAAPKVDVSPIGTVHVAARMTPQDVDLLQVIVPRLVGPADDLLAIPVHVADLGRSLKHASHFRSAVIEPMSKVAQVGYWPRLRDATDGRCPTTWLGQCCRD